MLGRWSWVVFAFVGGIGVAMSVSMLFDPTRFAQLMADVGPPMPDSLKGPDASSFLSFMGFWAATALVGVNSLTVVIAATALRRRERWAAWAMSYWPLLFASHLVIYENPAMQAVQMGWIVLSVGAIAAVLRAGPAGPRPPTR